MLLLTLQASDAYWGVVLACPRVAAPGVIHGTGVVVGLKDGFGYVLTANHVAVSDRVEVRFTSREGYPKPAWYGDGATVIARWPDPDLALIKFPIATHTPSVIRIAPAWQRPKVFPVGVMTVGVGSHPASIPLQDSLKAKECVRREGKGPAFFWRTETAPEPGRSGGALLDSHGRLIGITVAVRSGSGYYSHHDEIVAALKQGGYGWLVDAVGK